MPLQRALGDAGLLPAGDLPSAAIRLRLLGLTRLLRLLRLVRLLRLIWVRRLRAQQRGTKSHVKQDRTNDKNKFLCQRISQHHVISIEKPSFSFRGLARSLPPLRGLQTTRISSVLVPPEEKRKA